MQVVNCSSTVLAISAQYTVLAAQASTVLSFDIFLTSSQANQALSCIVSLVNTEVGPHISMHPRHTCSMCCLCIALNADLSNSAFIKCWNRCASWSGCPPEAWVRQ